MRKPPPEGQRVHQSPSSVVSEQPAKIPADGTAEVQVRSSLSGSRAEPQLELSDPPEEIVIDNDAWQDRIVAITLRSDAEKTKPGLRGNLIANVFQKRTEANKEGKTRELCVFMGPLSAIPFEVVKP